MKTIFACILLFCGLIGFCHDSLDFVFPVDHQVRLTGNFMELRDNHFHAGIDIKSSRGVTGDKIKSVGEGYVSRIRITSGSYGNALYINHPNGYTSVYAHLEEFIPEIQEYLSDIQYSLESFEVDVYLPDSLLSVSKGQKIGIMGNTGRSFGPHLHFELRETKSELPVNPEKYGIGPSDSKAPVLQSLCIYNLDKYGSVSDTEVKYFNPKKNNYRLYTDLVEVKSNNIGLGMQMYDTMNGSTNKNGVYSYKLYVDDSLHFEWKADVFSFYESRKINGFIDYERKKKYAQKIYLLYKQNCNSFSGYKDGSDGVIKLSQGQQKKVRILIEDIKGNQSQTSFVLRRTADDLQEAPKADFDCKDIFHQDQGIFSLDFDKETFFSSRDLEFESGKKEVLGQRCHYVRVSNTVIPVSKYFKISCPLPKDYNEQWTIVSTDSRGRFVDFGADTLDNRLYTWVDQLGEYYVFKDKLAPTAEIINIEASMSKPWKIRIKDNLIPDGRVDDLYYEVRVNGQWINMQYDLKNNVLVFDDFDRLPQNPSSISIILSDNCGNQKEIVRNLR